MFLHGLYLVVSVLLCLLRGNRIISILMETMMTSYFLQNYNFKEFYYKTEHNQLERENPARVFIGTAFKEKGSI